MKASFVDAIFPVADFVFEQLLGPPGQGKATRQVIQDRLARLLTAAERVGKDWKGPTLVGVEMDTVSRLHYALTCWVDEIFTSSPLWEEEWPDNRLELRFADHKEHKKVGNLRAERIPALAKAALEHGFGESAEVYWWLFHLGFRGAFTDSELSDWERGARDFLREVCWADPPPPEGEPPAPPEPEPLPLLREGRPRTWVALGFAGLWLLGAVALLLMHLAGKPGP